MQFDDDNSEYSSPTVPHLQHVSEANGDNGESSQLGHKVEIMDINNGWNDKNERIVISLGENAASYKWMHEKSASIFRVWQKILSIILIIFSTGLSAETTLLPDDSNHQYVVILRKTFTYIVTILSVLLNFLKFESLSEQHVVNASAFGQLYHDIQQQMCLYRRDRKNAMFYITKILKKYDSLIVNGPNMAINVINQFKKTFGNSNIAVPDIADRIQKIEIVDEPSVAQRGLQTRLQPPEQAKASSNLCNLQQIHDAFQIHGDISDKDLENASATELKTLRERFLKEKSNFEYQRFMQHTQSP
jgi:hypothetical protein